MKLLNRSAPPVLPRTPPDRRLYVVGDIHGRDDLLAALHRQILEDSAGAPAGSRVVIYLGDYVDRGLNAFEVIERLIADPLPAFEQVCLMGNHEDMMLKYLTGPVDPLWLYNGGDATLASYGVTLDGGYYEMETLERARRQLLDRLPASHLAFLQSLKPFHCEGDYFFVHAGVRPGRPLDAQDSRDMMWIRGPFLEASEDFGKCVVHGHSIVVDPEIHGNRIGIDTGAFFSGRLTCLVLDGAERHFLRT